MYFVCTREEDDCKKLYGGAWGYYHNRQAAVDAVHRNVTDMHETIYVLSALKQRILSSFVMNTRTILGRSYDTMS